MINVKNNILIDYLTFTFNYEAADADAAYTIAIFDYLYKFLPLLGYERYETFDLDKAFYGYPIAYGIGINLIFQCGLVVDSNAGIYNCMFEFGGKACRELEARGVDWIRLCSAVLEKEGSFTRLDLAHDRFNSYLIEDYNNATGAKLAVKDDFSYILENLQAGNCSSQFKKYQYICSSTIGADDGAVSLTLGAGDLILQIYDKLKEREARSYVIGQNVKIWIRYEIRYKRAYATSAVQTLIEAIEKDGDAGLIEFYFNTMRRLLLIKVPSLDSKKHQVKNCAVWDYFLKDSRTKLNLTNQYALERSITTKADWVMRSVGKTLKVLEYSLGRDNFEIFLSKLMNEKAATINPRDWHQIEAFQTDFQKYKSETAEAGFNPDSFQDFVESERHRKRNHETIMRLGLSTEGRENE